MGDIIIQSQQDFDAKYLTPTNAKEIVDFFSPKDLKIAAPSGFKKRKIQPIGSPSSSGGDTLVFQVANSGMLSDAFLEIGIAATSGGNYAANVGLGYPSRVRLLHSGQELCNYEYSAVTQVKLGRMPVEQSARIYTAAGGAAAATAKRVYCPLWLPGGSIGHSRGDQTTPLPLFMSSEALQLEIDVRTVANLLASGGSGSSITSVKLVYYELNVSDEEKQRIKSQPWKMYYEDMVTLSQTSIATSTLTTLDISGFKNSIKSLAFPCVTVANQDTNHTYVLNTNYDSAELLADGIRLWYSEYANETIFEELLLNRSKTGSDAVLGKCQEISFNKIFSQDVYSGALNTSPIKKLEFAVTQSQGANIYVKPTAVRNCFIVYQDNGFKRIL